MKLRDAMISCAALLAACHGNDDDGGASALRQAAATGPSTMADVPCVNTPPAPLDVRAYAVRGEFDWSAQRLKASVTVEVQLTSSQLVLDSAVEKVQEVRSALGRALPFMVVGEKLYVDLTSVPHCGAPVTVVIDYVANTRGALVALDERAGETSRVLFTSSEPVATRQWMPSNDQPADRARFGVELTIRDGETLVSNGTLTRDERVGGQRVMAYATQYTLPTYLMAMAVGTFDRVERTHGDVPISVVHRRGLQGNWDDLADKLVASMRIFEDRLGPYPFDHYSVVLLPAYVGGSEHAEISFQDESTTVHPGYRLSLSAHELAHQWFGDHVTVATWDDLWIKEGMATLLEREVVRAIDEPGVTGPAGAAPLSYSAAIIDPDLAPDDKYTSGPYDRAAWLLTQLRDLMGDGAFWAFQRRLLDDHALGTISTAQYLEALRPHLTPAQLASVESALYAHAAPELRAELRDGAPVVTLHDPEGSIVAPVELSWLTDGALRPAGTLTPGASLALRPPAASSTLLFDRDDAHPAYASLRRAAGQVLDAFFAVGAGSLSTWTSLPAALQGEGFLGALPVATPAEALALYRRLGSDVTRARLVAAACARAAGDPAGWRAAIRAMLTERPPYRGLTDAWLAYCQPAVEAETYFAPELAALETTPSRRVFEDERIDLLRAIGVPAARALPVWSKVIEEGYSSFVQGSAASALLWHAYGRRGFEGPTEAQKPAWRAAIGSLMAKTQVPAVVSQLVYAPMFLLGTTEAEHRPMVDGLIRVIQNPLWRNTTRGVRGHAIQFWSICSAHYMGSADGVSWERFKAKAMSAPLQPSVRPVLDNPSASCD